MARTVRNISSAAEHIAGITQQLAVLLEAGVTPASAWVYSAEMISEPGPDDAVVAGRADLVRSIAQDVSTGRAPGEAIREAQGSHTPEEHRAWASVAAAWTVATAAGSPLAPTLQALSGALRDTARLDQPDVIDLLSLSRRGRPRHCPGRQLRLARRGGRLRGRARVVGRRLADTPPRRDRGVHDRGDTTRRQRSSRHHVRSGI